MARLGWSGMRAKAILGAVALTAGVVVALPTAAAAAGGELGELGIKGVGTVYTGPRGLPILVTTAGAAATFTVEVVNTGSATSQYDMFATVSGSCDPSGCPVPALAVTAGSLNVTPSITGANGYFTAPIAAGKTALLTVKLTLPKTGVPDNLYGVALYLEDTAGNVLSVNDGYVEIKTTTGTTSFDQFFNGAGQATVRAPANDYTYEDGVSSSTISSGQSATYTDKLQNDSPLPGAITYHLSEISGCATHYAVSVKAGSVDVTAQALAGTYETPVLAQGKSTVLTVKITMTSSPDGCLIGSQDEWASVTSTGSGSAQGILVVDTALGA